MAVPGIQISEIWDALVRCKEIYEAFSKGYNNAAGILADFRDDFARAEQALEFQKTVYERTGKKYPGAESFKAVLTRCASFIADNKKLLDRDHGKESFAGALQTVTSVFKRDIPKLREALSQKIQEFANWKIDLLLELAFARAEQPVAAASGQHNTDLAPDGTVLGEDQLRRDVDELVSIIYAHGRLLKSGHSGTTEANVAAKRLNARFWTTIASICRHGNMPEDYRPPSVFLQELSRDLLLRKQQASIESVSGTARYTRNEAMMFPRAASVRIYIDAGGNREIRLEAYGYIFVGRQFLFLDDNGRPICEHRVSRDCPPFTPRITDKGLERRVVEFLEAQDVTVFVPEVEPLATSQHVSALVPRSEAFHRYREKNYTANCKYWFERRDYSQYLQFQSDLRGVQLRSEFQVSKITSKKSRAGSDADQVRIKLWYDDHAPENAFLSSFTEFSTRKIFEWPLRWFQPPQQESKTSVRLEFIIPSSQVVTPVAQSPDGSVFAWFGRATGHVRRSSSNSLVNVSSAVPSIRSMVTHQPAGNYAHSDWLSKVKYLHLEFASAQDCPVFTKEVIRLQTEVNRSQFAASPGPSSGVSTLPSSTYESLLESPEITPFISVGSPITTATTPAVAVAGPSRSYTADSNNSANSPMMPCASISRQNSWDAGPSAPSNTIDLFGSSMLFNISHGELGPQIATPETYLDQRAIPSGATPGWLLGLNGYST